MDRRSFLAATSGTAAIGLAGCSGLLGSNPARLENLTFSGSESVEYGSNASIALNVTNSGGQDTYFEGSVRSTSEDLEYEREFNETVPAGETVQVDAGEVDPPAAGEYEFVVEGEPLTTPTPPEGGTPPEPSVQELTSATVEVSTSTLAAGDTITFRDGLALTVESVSFADAVFTGGDDPTGAFKSPTGKVFAIYDVVVENTGTETVDWVASERLSTPDGAVYGGESTPDVPGLGTPLGGSAGLSPSERLEGYVIAQFAPDAAATEARLAVQSGRESPTPEYEYPFAASSERALPEITLESVDVPDSTREDQPYEMTFTFANEGDGSGTVKAVLQFLDDGLFSSGWTVLDTASEPVIEREIDAGETVEVTVTNTGEGYSYDYRLVPFGREWTTEFE